MAHNTSDAWAMGDAYDAYMGRWSRLLAREFLAWLSPAPNGHWLEIGCGTGALTSSICAQCMPASVVASDPSAGFVEHARARSRDARVSYVAAAADAPPGRPGAFDVVVSGLVLTFIPEPGAALCTMRERVRPGGTVAAYVWDYAGGLEFLQCFWEEAVAFDPRAEPLDEARRFASWTMPHLEELFDVAGLTAIETAPITITTTFASFDDYWAPFLGGPGPAPSYVASLALPPREALAERLRARLPREADGSIRLKARALAISGVRPG